MRPATETSAAVPKERTQPQPGAVHALRPIEHIGLSSAVERRLVQAARDDRPVEGLTHKHYRYPARFSPVFVAEAIQALTEPGDLVADPFLGGGTSLVEALAARRRSFGIDISALATFVSIAKTAILAEPQLASLERWSPTLTSMIRMSSEEPEFAPWVEAGYMRNMGSASRWRLRKSISQAIAAIERIGDPELENLARCIVLRTAQWALDGRRQVPTVGNFRRALSASSRMLIEGARDLARQAGDSPFKPLIMNRSAIGLETDARITAAGIPRLILTSPPYPGVHVLYHRWQVDGRKESPTPFFIANALDGSGETHYTMGGRKVPGLPTYFEQLEGVLRSLAAIADEETTLVQVVAFAHPEWQLPKYLEVAERSGWRELGLRILAGEYDGRLWRTVPNRKWYADQRGHTNGAREVVLFHRFNPRAC
jgi:hypothetical protein